MNFADYGIRITKTSGQERTTCPVCSPTRKKSREKCLSVNIDDGVWYCQHCGYSGGLEGRQEDWYKPLKVYAKPAEAKTELPRKVLGWFAARGIGETVLERNKIGYEDRNIVFQYFENGIVVNQKFRSGAKNFRQVADAKKILYGLDDINGKKEFVIVEGEMDKLAIEEAGIKCCVSVPDGAPAPDAKNFSSKFTFLDDLDVESFTKIIIAVDSDLPGQRLEEELIRRLGHERCWVAAWPNGCKDANEVLIKYGKEGVLTALNSAIPVPVDGIVSDEMLVRGVDSLYEYGLERGERTSWDNVDAIYTVRLGEITIVTGIPSHGKSEWLDSLLVNLVNRLGWRFTLFSPENFPVQLHGTKLIQKFLRETFDKRWIDGETKEHGKAWLIEHFTFLDPCEDDLTLDCLLDLTRISVMRRGIKGLILDPWNEIEHKRQAGMSETEYVSESLTKIRRFARKYKIHVWIVAHPTKLRKNDNGEYPVPTPYDISGSAHWRNKADNCIAVWRNVTNENSAVEVHVQKVRFRTVGKAGMAELFYDVRSGTYSEVETKNFMDI